jgi:hypothetical protein
MFRVITSLPEGVRPEDDQIYRAQMQAAQREDAKDVYKLEPITVSYGLPGDKGKYPTAEVTLRYPLDAPYLFCCLSDNAACERLAYPDWVSLANEALQKFAAMRGLPVKLGPRAEDHNKYSQYVETNRPIEMQPETVARFAQQKADAEARQAAEAERARLARLMVGA